MKLLRCNIVNYGCLHDFSYEFKEGINLINRPNGWGKTTFVSFLCAMLYGLDSTNRRSIQDNERKHYFPWQGEPFGGSIEFEVSGKQYRAERFFGRREKEDTFTLYDLKTMLPCQDYTARLGFELFGIDKRGYLKSTCIPQGKPAPEYNDTLAARLTGLTRSSDDMNRYEKAVGELDKAMRFYVKTGNRGEIALLQQQADAFSGQLRKASEASLELTHLNSELNSLNKQKDCIQNQLNHIQDQIRLCTDMESQARYDLLKHQLSQKETELEHLDDFFHDQFPEESDIDACLLSCSRLSQLQLQAQREAFDSAQLSEFAVLRALFDSADQPVSEDSGSGYSVLSGSEEIFSATQQQILNNTPEYRIEASVLFAPEDFFSGDIPEADSIEPLPDARTIRCAEEFYNQYTSMVSAQEDSTQRISSLSAQLEHLNTELEQEYQNISDCRRKLQIREQNFKSQHAHKQEKEQRHTFAPAWILFLLIFAAVSLLAGYFTTPVIGCIVLITGAVLIAVVIRNQQIQLETELQLRSDTCSRLEKQAAELQKKLEAATSEASDISDGINSCLQQLLSISRQLHLPQDNVPKLLSEYPAHLTHLNKRLDSQHLIRRKQEDNRKKQLLFYNRLAAKYHDYTARFRQQRQLEQHISDLKKSIVDYLYPYFSVTEKDTSSALEVKLHELKSMVDSYKKLLSEMHSASQRLNAFLKEHPDFQKEHSDFQQKHSESEPCYPLSSGILPSLSDLQSEDSLLRSRYAACIQEISFCQSQIHQQQNIAAEYPVLREKISKLELQISQYQERYRILSLTRRYLVKARQDFSDSYLRSIEKNFSHYAEMLQKSLLQNTSIDSNFHVLVSDSGILRETGWYSQGTRDLIDLCFRLSIIEDLFPDEAPFLVLDDPFVNLDEPSLHCMTDILHNIADKWQILYFTCHSSRNIYSKIKK